MSKAEDTLEFQMRALGLEFEREYRFHPERKWRFDFANSEKHLAIEVEGVTWFGKNGNGTMRLGRHQTAKGLEEDLQKYEAAMLFGWTIYRCSQNMVKTGQAISAIQTLYQRAG